MEGERQAMHSTYERDKEEGEIYCVSKDFVVRWNMKIQNKTNINWPIPNQPLT